MSPRKQLSGVVIRAKLPRTVTVRVTQAYRHPRYKKLLRRSRNYLVDTNGRDYQPGARVVIEETRPLSRRKHFRIVRLAGKARMEVETHDTTAESSESGG